MDTDTLVEKQLDDSQKLIEELARRGFEVMAACWLKTNDDYKWSFTIVSPAVDTEGIIQAYGRLDSVLQTMPQGFGFDQLKIRLVGPSDRLAQDVLTAIQRTPGPRVSPFRYRGIWLGNMSIEAAYLFRQPAPTLTPN